MYRLVVLFFFVIFLAACAPNQPAPVPTATPTPEPERPTIALVMKTLTNPFFVEMERGAREAAAEFNIELIVRTAAQETSIEQQIQIVDELIEENVDAIVIAPGDSLELIPVLKRAQDAGITIVNIDNRLDPVYSENLELTGVPFISVDNENGAYLAAQYLAQQMSEPSAALILEGIRGAQNAEDRKNGAIRAFEESENVELVGSETANWQIEEAATVAETLFTEHPDVRLVFAANDMMALGVVQYLQEANKTDVLVAGYDALAEARQAITDGAMAATVDQQAARQGYLGVQYAVQMLNGEEVPAETMVDVILVTPE